jgi:hypothetical protein
VLEAYPAAFPSSLSIVPWYYSDANSYSIRVFVDLGDGISAYFY